MELINFIPQFKILILFQLCTFSDLNRFLFSFSSFSSFACELKSEQHENKESHLNRFSSSDLSLSLEHFHLSAGLLKLKHTLTMESWVSTVAQKAQQKKKVISKQKPVGGRSNAPYSKRRTTKISSKQVQFKTFLKLEIKFKTNITINPHKKQRRF